MLEWLGGATGQRATEKISGKEEGREQKPTEARGGGEGDEGAKGARNTKGIVPW